MACLCFFVGGISGDFGAADLFLDDEDGADPEGREGSSPPLGGSADQLAFGHWLSG